MVKEKGFGEGRMRNLIDEFRTIGRKQTCLPPPPISYSPPPFSPSHHNTLDRREKYLSWNQFFLFTAGLGWWWHGGLGLGIAVVVAVH